jgi:peptide/nickel transport system substrate-binding protein
MDSAGQGVTLRRRALLKATALASLAGGTFESIGRAKAAPANFVFGNPSEYDTLDPHTVADLSRVAVRLNFYDGLYRWADNPPKLMPWLAASHTVSDDGLTYRFRLRPNSRFHDGAPVTADDVVYSVERLLALKKGSAGLFSPILVPGSTRAIDPLTVEFKLNKSAAIFLSIIPEIAVVNSRLLRANATSDDWAANWLAQNEAGSGSYQLDTYNPAVALIAKRFPGHFLGWTGNHLDRLEFRVVRETTSLLLGLQRGDLDDIDLAPSSDQLSDLRKSPTVAIDEQPSLRLFILHLNNQRAPFTDVHIRRAISYAFDYDSFINDILAGTAERNPAPMPKPMWGYPTGLQGYTYDLDKARHELSLAAVKIDRPLEIHTLVGADQSDQAATLLQAGLQELGIATRIIPETWPTLSGKARQVETTPDIWANWISTIYPDPNNWVGEMYNSRNWGSWKTGSWYKNPKVDALLDEAYVSTDQAKREQNYQEACRQVVEDAASVFIYNSKWFGLFSKRLQGYRFTPVGNGEDFRWISLA